MTPVLFARFAERWPPPRHRCWRLTSSLSPSARRSSIRVAAPDTAPPAPHPAPAPRRRPAGEHAPDAATSCPPSRTIVGPPRLQNVGGADKTGHKCGHGVQIEILRGIHLLNAPVVKHRHAIRHRQRFALVVGHEDEGDPQRLLQLFSSTCICSRSFKSGRPAAHRAAAPRLVHQRPGNRDPLPLAAGELGGLAMMSKAKGHLLQRLTARAWRAFFAMPLTIRP